MQPSVQNTLVPIVLQNGINQKIDSKVLQTNLIALENRFMTKLGRLEKRYGFKALGNKDSSGNSITSGNKLAVFGEDLLLLNQDKLYSYVSSKDNWQIKGNLTTSTVTSTPVVRNANSQYCPDTAYLNGIAVTVWEDRTPAASPTSAGVFYSVTDTTSNSALVASAPISATGKAPKVVALANGFLIFYLDGAGSPYDLMTAFVSSAALTTLVTNAAVATGYVKGLVYDIMNYQNAAVYAIHNTSDKVTVGYVDETGAASVLLPSPFVDMTADDAVALGLTKDEWTSSIFLAVATSAAAKLYRVDSGLAGGATNLVASTLETVVDIKNISPIFSDNKVKVFYEVGDRTPAIDQTVHFNSAIWDNLARTLTPATAAIVDRSVGLVTKAFTDSTKAYCGVVFASAIQPVYFVIDETGQVIAKIAQGLGGGLTVNSVGTAVPHLSSVAVDAEGNFVFSAQIRVRYTTENGTGISATFGLNTVGLNLDDFSYNSDTLGNNLVISGGIVSAYDGNSVTELGFNVFPDTVTKAAKGAEKITFATGAVTDPADYVVITDANGGTWALWMREDNFGGPPSGAAYVAAAHKVTVPFPSVGTAIAVAGAFYAVAIAQSIPGLTFTDNGNGTVTISGTLVASPTVPHNFNDSTAGSITVTGAQPYGLINGEVSYRAIYEWTDAKGQVHRSAPSITTSIGTGVGSDIALVNNQVIVTVSTLRLSKKTGVKIVLYRDTAGSGVVFYRTQELANNPTVDSVTFTDNATDVSISSNEILYTTGDILENIAPPACKIVHRHQNRMFLAGLENQDTFWYSKEYVPGEGLSFSDGFVQQNDARGGSITALGTLDDKLIVFKDSATFFMSGNGPLDTGANDDFIRPQLVQGDVGAKGQDSIVITPNGVMFQSDKGIWLIDRSLGMSYLGAPAEDFNSFVVTGAAVVADSNQVRFTTREGITIVYDYYFQQWYTFTNYYAVSSVIWAQNYIHLTANGKVHKDTAGLYNDNGAKIKTKIETGWLAPGGLQGFQRLRDILLLGEYNGEHTVSVKLAYDYEKGYNETVLFAADEVYNINLYGSGAFYGQLSPFGGGTPSAYQFTIKPARQKCESFKLVIEDIDNKQGGGPAFSLTSISCWVGLKANRDRLPAIQSGGN